MLTSPIDLRKGKVHVKQILSAEGTNAREVASRLDLQCQHTLALKLFLEAAGDGYFADRQHPDYVVAGANARTLRCNAARRERVASRGGRCTTQHVVGADLEVDRWAGHLPTRDRKARQ